MTLKKWTEYLEKIDETASRNKMTEIIGELLKETETSQVDKMTYLILGRLGPLYDNPQFNLAEKQIQKAIASAFDVSLEEVSEHYKKSGDLGVSVFFFRERAGVLKIQETSVSELYDRLLQIAVDEGEGSQDRKIQSLAALFKDIDAKSGKYVARIVMGKLRLGFLDKTILDALSVATKGDKTDRAELELAYQIQPDVGLLTKTVKEGGIAATKKIKAKIGVPIMPMLCQRLKTAKEMVKKMGTVAIEPKFDGTRVSIHFSRTGKDWKIKTYTRNLEENSAMFPELLKMAEHVDANELVLDSEAVGYDVKTDKLLPFQMTITRKRKHGIEEQASLVPLKFFVFDVLYKDGESLIDKSYVERRKILKDVIKDRELLVVDDYWVTDKPDFILDKHQEMLDKGLEGIIVKQPDSKYVPGRTGWRWVKMKEVEAASAKLSDTLDCVVMGFYPGKGKRTQFGIGKFLVGVRDGDDNIVTIAKIGTGLTDEQFRELKKKLDRVVTSEKPAIYNVTKSLLPDVWVEPEVVVEVAADEITKSPVHSAGVALRFPRLVKFRDDKSWQQITTIDEVGSIAP